MVDRLTVARCITAGHGRVAKQIDGWQWALKLGQAFADPGAVNPGGRRRLPRAGGKWHLDEVVVKIAGVKHWLRRAVEQDASRLEAFTARVQVLLDAVLAQPGTRIPGAGRAARRERVRQEGFAVAPALAATLDGAA